MISPFECSGKTSWGMKWHMVYPKGIAFIGRQGGARMLFAHENGKMTKHLLDPTFRMTPLQLKEAESIANLAYLDCFDVICKVIDASTDIATALLAPFMHTVTNLYMFLASNEYHHIIHAVASTVRKNIGMEGHEYDDLFVSAFDADPDSDEEDGPIFALLDEHMIHIAHKLAPEGTACGWVLDPRTGGWNPNPRVNPVTGEVYNGKDVL